METYNVTLEVALKMENGVTSNLIVANVPVLSAVKVNNGGAETPLEAGEIVVNHYNLEWQLESINLVGDAIVVKAYFDDYFEYETFVSNNTLIITRYEDYEDYKLIAAIFFLDDEGEVTKAINGNIVVKELLGSGMAHNNNASTGEDSYSIEGNLVSLYIHSKNASDTPFFFTQD